MFATTGAVLIDDEFLRDGLQNESRAFSLAEKLGFVTALEQAGVRRIELGSFVHPKLVPQMADTDALFAAITAKPGVTYTALILNMAGLERAITAGARHLSISVSASQTHSRKNLNKTVDEARAGIVPILERALSAGIAVRAGIQSALGGLGGCPFIPAATGNIATEDAVFALSEMGFATGIDWRALIPAVHAAEAALGRRLPGRMAHLANPEARA